MGRSDLIDNNSTFPKAFNLMHFMTKNTNTNKILSTKPIDGLNQWSENNVMNLNILNLNSFNLIWTGHIYICTE